MSKSKQTTLFQSWGGASVAAPTSKTSTKQQPKSVQSNASHLHSKFVTSARSNVASVIDLCQDSDDDADLLAAMEESLRYASGNYNCDNKAAPLSENGTNCHRILEDVRGAAVETRVDVQGSKLFKSVAGTTGKQYSNKSRINTEFPPIGEPSYGIPSMEDMETTAVEDLPGFDSEAGRIWIYPTNYPVRDYQFRIVEQALMHNTMVTLPTGLGKTFVAAVVMFNFYRWYPTSKIVFMAPTKPLVAQQIEACHAVVGIPMEDTAEMTG